MHLCWMELKHRLPHHQPKDFLATEIDDWRLNSRQEAGRLTSYSYSFFQPNLKVKVLVTPFGVISDLADYTDYERTCQYTLLLCKQACIERAGLGIGGGRLSSYHSLYSHSFFCPPFCIPDIKVSMMVSYSFALIQPFIYSYYY